MAYVYRDGEVATLRALRTGSAMARPAGEESERGALPPLTPRTRGERGGKRSARGKRNASSAAMLPVTRREDGTLLVAAHAARGVQPARMRVRSSYSHRDVAHRVEDRVIRYVDARLAEERNALKD